jgi:ribosomal protein L7/L12
MLLFQISNHDGSVRVERAPGSNKIEISSRALFIKMVKNSTQCSLIDAQNFVDNLTEDLNQIEPKPQSIREKISVEIAMMGTDDLLDILRFVRSCRDYPKPSDG